MALRGIRVAASSVETDELVLESLQSAKTSARGKSDIPVFLKPIPRSAVRASVPESSFSLTSLSSGSEVERSGWASEQVYPSSYIFAQESAAAENESGIKR